MYESSRPDNSVEDSAVAASSREPNAMVRVSPRSSAKQGLHAPGSAYTSGQADRRPDTEARRSGEARFSRFHPFAKLTGFSQLPYRKGNGRCLTSGLSTQDDLRSATKSLQELCRFRLAYAIHLLHAELETVIKLPLDSMVNSTGKSASISNLQSQMFIARIMTECLDYHRESRKQAIETEAASAVSLDDRTAKQLLGTVSFFLRQSTVLADHCGNNHLLNELFYQGLQQKSPLVMAAPSTYLEIVQDISCSTATIVSCICEARWDIMLTKLRNLLAYYASSEDSPDLTEVPLFALCSLDEHRLSGLLSELSIFPQLKRTAQLAIAGALKSALSCFIRSHPNTLQVMYEEQRRTAFSGQPQVLFDLIFAVSESSKRRAVLWPVLAIVLALCPEVVADIVIAGGSGADARMPLYAKKLQFLDSLRHFIHESSNTDEKDIALACYASLCRMASFTTAAHDSQASPLRMLVAEIERDLWMYTLDLSKLPTGLDGFFNTILVSQSLSALSLLHWSQISADILPRFLARNTSYQLKLIALNSCKTLLQDDQAVSWHPDSDKISSAICESVTGILHSIVTSVFGQDSHGSASWTPHPRFTSQIADEESEHCRLILLVLQIIEICPDTVLATAAIDTCSRIVWPADKLLRSHDNTASRSLALLSCLTAEHYPTFIQQQSLATIMRLANCDIDCNAQIALALGRYWLHNSKPRPNTTTTLHLYLIWLSECSEAGRLKEQANTADIAFAISEAIGIITLCAVDDGARQASLGFHSKLSKAWQGCAQIKFTNAESIAAALAADLPPLLGGRIAQSKHQLRIFRAIKSSSAGLDLAWYGARRQWYGLAGLFGVPRSSEVSMHRKRSESVSLQLHTDSEEASEVSRWVLLSGFLVSTLSIFAHGPLLEFEMLEAGEHLLESSLQGVSKSEMANACLKDVANLLDAEHPRIRDAIREILAGDLHPQYCLPLVDIFRVPLETFLDYGRLETASSEVTLFFDQSLVVLCGLLSRCDATGLATPDASHVEDHLIAAAYYANRQEPSGPSHRIKMQVCRTAEAFYRIQASATSEHPASHPPRNAMLRFLLAIAEESAVTAGDRYTMDLAVHAAAALQHCARGLRISRNEGVLQSDNSTDHGVLASMYTRLSSLIEQAALAREVRTESFIP